MDGTPDTNGTTTADNGGEFDPREAAALLEQTKREARRQLNLAPPVVTAVMAVVVLAAYTSLWLSAGSAFAGPVNVWLAMGIGLCVALVASTVANVRLHRA